MRTRFGWLHAPAAPFTHTSNTQSLNPTPLNPNCAHPHPNSELGEVTISAGLISRADGDALKALLRRGPVAVALNWTDSLPRAERVRWELWADPMGECGALCDRQRAFIKAFKDAGKELERQGLLDFSPHHLLWTCAGRGGSEADCAAQCVRGGAYCSPDPDDDIGKGYSGADVLRVRIERGAVRAGGAAAACERRGRTG